MSTTSAVLELDGIVKSYPGVRALKGIDLQVAGSSVHALLGENGAGKSTLIRVLSGAERPDSGTMRFAGRPYAPASPLVALRSGLSTLYQEQSLFPDRSVAHNVLVGDEPRRAGLLLDRRAMRATTRALLDRLGADHVSADALVVHLSLADRQLVDVARALHRRARLLIMDEPTAALTSREVDALFEVVTGLPALGVSVLFVSHRMEEIFRISDTVTVLRDGEHVLTRAASSLAPDDLVRAMVGRDPDSAFPLRRDAAQPAEPVMTAVQLDGPGFADVSVTIRAGEVLAVAGVTGSGKEGLGMALFGAAKTSGGQLRVNGRPERLTPRRAAALGIAGVPSDRKGEGVVEDLSVRRNLSLPVLSAMSTAGVLSRRREQENAEARIRELTVRTGSPTTLVRQLSGGNQQKVSLGKWLTRRPAVLVLLEPTQGIDVAVRFEFYRLVRRLAERGTAVVLVSSDVPEVLGMSDRIAVLRSGRLVGELDGVTATAEALLRLSLGELADETGRPPTDVVERRPGPGSGDT